MTAMAEGHAFRLPSLRFTVQPAKAVGGFVIVLAVWELVALSGRFPRNALPAPQDLPSAFSTLVRDQDLGGMVLVTLRRVLIGGAIGLALGLLLGSLVAINRLVAYALSDLVGFFQSVGEVGWLPVLLLWLGFNDTTIVVTIAYTVIFPVYFGTVSGFAAVPKNLTNSLLTLGGNRWHVVREVLLPGALPAIITGFRTGMGFGWRTVILAELLVGGKGLGVLLFQGSQAFRADWIVAEMIVIGFIWLAIDNLVLKPVERLTIERWGALR
jgi:taurine transport system permease protein